jgi:hypothetical protein
MYSQRLSRLASLLKKASIISPSVLDRLATSSDEVQSTFNLLDTALEEEISALDVLIREAKRTGNAQLVDSLNKLRRPLLEVLVEISSLLGKTERITEELDEHLSYLYNR